MSFVVVIVKNIAITMYNKRKKQDEISFHEEYMIQEGDSEMSRASTNTVEEQIYSLPELYAETMVLRYLHACTEDECCKLLGISPAAFRKRLERGRKLLKESLEQEEGVTYV